MKYSLWLITTLIGLSLLGCNQGNIEMDNAGGEDLVVIIDELAYQVPAGAFERIDLEAGTHRIIIKSAEDKELDRAEFEVIEGGLLNLAKSPYYIWVDLYGEAELRKEKLKEEWIDIGNESFFGEFDKLPADVVFIEKKWNFGLDEDFPDDLYGWKMAQDKWIIKRKLFREEGLIQAYKSMVQE